MKVNYGYPELLTLPRHSIGGEPCATCSTRGVTICAHSRFHDARQGRVVHRQHTVSVLCKLFERKYRIVGAGDDIVIL